MASILKGQSGQPIQFETKPNVNGDDVLTRPEIVGTVSQSGGVPTGAIIQRGSNANGEFVKFADGALFCRVSLYDLGPISNSNGNLFMSDPYTWTLPTATINDEYVMTGRPGSASTLAWVVQGGAQNSTSTSFRLVRAASDSRTDRDVHLFMMGRWF